MRGGEGADVAVYSASPDGVTIFLDETRNILDLGLLGAEFADFVSITLNVPVSTFDASDFIIG